MEKQFGSKEEEIRKRVGKIKRIKDQGGIAQEPGKLEEAYS